MYFYKDGKKQIVDFTGDFILTHNDGLLTARFKSAAPRGAKHARYVTNIHNLGFFGKCRVAIAAIRFIWGPNTSLAPEQIEENNNNAGS